MQDLDTSNRRRCCVPGCNSRTIPFSFYKFPQNKIKSHSSTTKVSSENQDDFDRHEEWKRRIGLLETNENTVVCSRHFTEDDYYFADNNLKVKRLKQNAVPNINLGFDPSLTAEKIKSEFHSEIILPDKSDNEESMEFADTLREPSAKTLKTAIFDLNEPIVIRNILRSLNGEYSWEILNWDLETLAEKFGDKLLPFRTGYKAQTTKPQWEAESRVTLLTMKDWLKRKDPSNWHYFDYKYMHEWCKDSPELLNSFNWNRLGFDLGGKDSTIWIGNVGAHTNCHQDSYGCNLVAQIHGQKEWILFPPEAGKYLRPSRVPYEESTIYSSINFFSPSEEEENHLKNISGARIITLEPGEVLFIPKGWWHYVESLNFSVSVNVWLPLETDCEARLKESLVKLIVNGIGKNVPTSSENDKCSFIESLNYVNASLEEYCNRKRHAVSEKNNEEKIWTCESLTNTYPLFIFSVPSVNSQRLQKQFADKRKRFSEHVDNVNNTLIKQEQTDSSNQILTERILNAFCESDTIEKVASSLLNQYSLS